MFAIIYCYCFIAIFYIRSGCGKAPKKIIHGSPGAIEDSPYLVSIQDSIGHLCGGCFIDKVHILTAAHCVVDDDNVFVNDIQIYSGTNDLEEMTFRHEVNIIICHSNFESRISMAHDIAILKLRNVIDPSPIRKPFPYITRNEPPAGSIALFSGWGCLTLESHDPSRYLKKIELRILSNHECERITGFTIEPGRFCTTNIGKGTINKGDSGGGLIYNGEIIGIGVTVFRRAPISFFTRVYAYKSWIQNAVNRY